MNRREAKAHALALLASRAEDLADPLLGDGSMSDEDNDKIGQALTELADELTRRAGRFDAPPEPRRRSRTSRVSDDDRADAIMARVAEASRRRAAGESFLDQRRADAGLPPLD